MAKKKRNTSRFDSEAAAQALVRYGPQVQVLEEARRTAQGNYRAAVEQAKAGELGVRQAIDDVTPQVRDIYETAGLGALGSQSLMSKDLAGLGSVADSIKAGASLEAGATANRLRAAQAQALTGLADRRVQAATGAATARRAAQAKLVSDLEKILSQTQSLAGQQGAFEAATAGQLREAQRERNKDINIANAGNEQSERNSMRSAGIDPDTGQPIKGGKLDPSKGPKRLPGGAKLQSTSAHSSFKDKLNATLSVARPLVEHARKTGVSRRQVAQTLLSGVDGYTEHDPDTGRVRIDDSGRPVTVPTVKAQPEFLTSLALDLLFDGHLSRRNVNELHGRGLSVRKLKLPSRGKSAQQIARDGARQTARVFGG